MPAGSSSSAERAWLTVVLEDGVHVVPAIDGEAVDWHEPSATCGCGPELIRSGPLDDPVISHREPGWPGAKVGLP